MDFTARYRKLNKAQKQAVDTIDGPVMVIAGPGTGKTELLSMRAANILRQTDTLAENILCLTFTESGAAAMRQRLLQTIGSAAYKVAIHTFHSFGSEIINQNGEFFYHGAHFRAADELSSYELLRTIFDELPHDNPLASKMNDEYTHLGDTLSVISELKKSGLTSDELAKVCDANDSVIKIAEPLLARIFAARLTKTTASQLEPLVKTIRASDGEVALPGITPLSPILADSLQTAIDEAANTNSTKPVTAWRNAWMKKNDKGDFVLKSRERQAKLRAAGDIYEKYLAIMQEEELYDFDDMILRVVHAMEVFPDLRYNLQEKYQYIMVDEFQDTNLAQMRILHNLAASDANNGQPNVLVVGDDDQAIYSFQGADVGNIHGFRELFPATRLIVLTDNYRSTDTILSHARSVITLGTERLENHIPELNKTLTAHQTHTASTVSLVELPTADSERHWLAETVATQIAAGTAPGDIAVLARRHHELVALLPHFARAGVPVNYERRDNILDIEIIQLLEHIADLLVAIYEQRHADANSLLPELLAHPAFAIPPQDLWRLSLRAHSAHQTWLETMALTPQFQPLQTWLITLSQALAHTPLEQMLDEIIGVPRDTLTLTLRPASQPPTYSLQASSHSNASIHKHLQPEPQATPGPELRPGAQPFVDAGERSGDQEKEVTPFTSPLYRHYFSPKTLAADPETYLTHLQSLTTLRQKLRDYHPDETPSLQCLLEFIQLHRQLGSTITASRPPSQSANAVTLMTAHKSKGLEYDSVYITGAIDTAWGEHVRSRSRLISYPENLPLAPAGDSYDERLRLFFVAMTRAKRQLTISYATSAGGKNTLRASFLAGDTWQATTPQTPDTLESRIAAAETLWYQPLIQPQHANLRDLLAPTLETYKLSATHLNAFLDVTRGGPYMFLLNNLLRFPQAVSPSAGYGSAIHIALQRAHAHLSATGHHRPTEDILHDFEEALASQHLGEENFQTYLQKGTDVLSAYLKTKLNTFVAGQKTELNFASQGVELGGARLTGSLDLVHIADGAITVTDYKTGRPSRAWEGKTDYEKIKLHKYQQQLMFYNLLVLFSRDYSKYKLDKAILQFVEPTPTKELVALQATFSRDSLEQFARLICVVWHRITTLNLPDTSAYEPTYKGILAFEKALVEGSI